MGKAGSAILGLGLAGAAVAYTRTCHPAPETGAI